MGTHHQPAPLWRSLPVFSVPRHEWNGRRVGGEHFASVFTPLAPRWDAFAVTGPTPDLGAKTAVVGG